METAYRSYFVTISLKSCRHLALGGKGAAICWFCRHLHKKDWWPFSARLVAADSCPIFVHGASSETGHFARCWVVARLSADNVPMAWAVQLWMSQWHLCQAFIFSTFCPTDASLRCVSAICLSGTMLCLSDTQSFVPDSLYLNPVVALLLHYSSSHTEPREQRFLHSDRRVQVMAVASMWHTKIGTPKAHVYRYVYAIN